MADDLKAAAKDFLIAEFKHFSELLCRNEQRGESRISFFIGLLRLGIGGISALLSKDQKYEKPQFIGLVCIGFLCLPTVGYVTWRRMLRRNAVTDDYKRQLDAIRVVFKHRLDGEDVLGGYRLFAGSDQA